MKKTMLAMVVWGIIFSANIYAQQDPNTPPAKRETPKAENPVVKIATTKGDIWVELEAQKAPISVANFLAYTKDGFYNGTIFHRVIKSLMTR